MLARTGGGNRKKKKTSYCGQLLVRMTRMMRA